jgi:hypothetical protein
MDIILYLPRVVIIILFNQRAMMEVRILFLEQKQSGMILVKLSSILIRGHS